MAGDGGRIWPLSDSVGRRRTLVAQLARLLPTGRRGPRRFDASGRYTAATKTATALRTRVASWAAAGSRTNPRPKKEKKKEGKKENKRRNKKEEPLDSCG
jgi:hypothetical protein